MDYLTRRKAISSAIETHGTVRVSELAEQFGVSEMSIRRDLKVLEQKGLAKRVHGWGINVRGRSYEPTLMLRSTVNIDEKKRIGRTAAQLLDEGNCVALDVGTTTEEVARSIIGKRNITVITPSLLIANILVNHPDIQLILPGGIVRQGETTMIGELSHRAFEIIHVDRLFLGVGGIHTIAGLTEYNWDDTLVKKAMLKTAKEVIVVADSSKFERIATVNIAPLKTMNILVTETQPPPNLAEALEKANVKVIIAK